MAVQESLKQYEDILRLQQPDTPHLTLVYWKEMMEIECRQAMAQAERIAARQAPFTLRVTGADTFGSRGRDSVLFLSVAFSPELAQLKKACPWPNPPSQPFHPHITLARIRRPETFSVRKKRIMKTVAETSFAVAADRMRFYAESGGQKQTPLWDVPLSG